MIASGTHPGNITFTTETFEDHVRLTILVKLVNEGFEADTEERRQLFERMSGLQWKNIHDRVDFNEPRI